MFTSVLVAPDVSGHDHFGTLCTGSSHGKSVQAPIRSFRDHNRDKYDSGLDNCTIQVTMYRQFARKVGPSANSALISYPSLRLGLSRLG